MVHKERERKLYQINEKENGFREREREQERALTKKMRKKNGLGSERERELYQIKMRKKMGSEREREIESFIR